MNTYCSPSLYRYCISRLSTMACSNFSSARYVRSITAPVRTFLSLVRTKAPPLPGFTCWKSTTEKRPSGRSRLMPLRRSLVLMLMTACSLLSLDDQLFRGVGQRDRSRLGDDHRVLDADAAVLGEIDTRLDGDDVPGGQRISRGGADRRRLVDVE